MTDHDLRLDVDHDDQEAIDMSDHDRKLEELEATIRKQDADYEAKQAKHEATIAELTGGRSIADYIEETMPDDSTLDETDADRLLLLDRLTERMPDLDLDQHEVGWTKLPDGNEALVIDGGGMDGGTGYFVANAPDSDDLHVVGPTAPMFPGKIGVVLIHADGSRELAKLVPDPLAGQEPD